MFSVIELVTESRFYQEKEVFQGFYTRNSLKGVRKTLRAAEIIKI